MKTALFIVSHLGSESNLFFNCLSKNPRIQGIRLGLPYADLTTYDVLTNQPHKMDSTAAIYMDELLYNFSFACPRLYEYCKFIYLVREAKPTLNKIISTRTSFDTKHTPGTAVKYYKYRLRRMCEMAKRSGGILLTWEDMHKNLGAVEKYLNLKEPLGEVERDKDVDDLIDADIINEAQESYERHLYYLRSFLTNS